MKTVLLLTVTLFFLGCSRTSPMITEYRIAAKESKVSLESASCKEDTIKVSQAFVKSSLMSKEMKYVVGDYEEYSYNQSEWAEHPNKAITNAVVASLEDAGIFANVTSYKSFSSSKYTLEINVADFTQYYSSDEKSSTANLDITFSLIDNQTSLIIASKHIVKKKKTQKADAKSGVLALNALLAQSLDELKIWIAKSCK